MKKNKNFFVFDENTHAFPEEKEALLQEGLEFNIIGKTWVKHENNWSYFEVHLEY